MQELEARHIVAVDDLLGLIISSQEAHGIEGVSFIGGEPFLQASSLIPLANSIREAGLSVLAFSGYTIEELRGGTLDQRELLDRLDILIDGPYLEDKPEDERGWVGSKNQAVYFITDRYKPGIEYVPINTVEILVGEEEILANGWPV